MPATRLITMFKLRPKHHPQSPAETPPASMNDPVSPVSDKLVPDDPRVDAARHIIKNHVIAAMSVTLVPVPLVDLLALGALQLRMVRQLARLYGLPFYRGLGRGLIAALLGAVLPTSAALSAASLVKSVPGLGTTVGVIGASSLGGAATYAVGHTFLRHFATGGNLLSFDPDDTRDYLQARFQEGKQMIRQWRRD